MIRFRFRKDEQRYVRLVSELYRDVAANLAPNLVSRVMRNLGKVEQLIFLEGVRQGLAIAEISNLSEQLGGPITVRDNKPFQAHALVYGSSDTPLVETEQQWLAKLGAEKGHGADAWLEGQPMRFAPQTLEEALQDEPQAPETPQQGAKVPEPDRGAPWASEDVEGARPLTDEEIARIIHGDSSDAESRSEPLPESDGGGPEAESPAFLDRVRDSIQSLQHSGSNIDSWENLIMALHLHMGVDAGFLDMQLATDMGRAVLDQCGLYNLHPGAAIDMSQVQRASDEQTADRSDADSDG